jgi:hypothetical protein
MRTIRTGLHSLVLVLADIAGIGVGASIAFGITGKSNQVWLQVPIAVILTIVGFGIWMLLLRALGLRRLQPVSRKEVAAYFLAALVWAPVVFVPLHYLTQGYLTSIGNLVGLALFQFPVNAIAAFGSFALLKPREVPTIRQHSP